jgi:hypothetical protein
MNLDDIIVNKAFSFETFNQDIEKLSKDLRISFLDAVVHYCETNSVEIESVASIIKTNPKMKAKLQEDAEELNFLPRRAKLPIGD